MIAVHIGVGHLRDKGVLGEHHRQRANHGDAAVMRLNGRAVRIRQKVLAQPGIEFVQFGDLLGILPGLLRECAVVPHQGAKRRPLRPAHIGFRIAAGKAIVAAGIDAPERQARGRDGKHAGQGLPHAREGGRLVSAKLAGVGLAPGRTGPLEQDVVLPVSALEKLPVAARVVQCVTVVHFLAVPPVEKDRFVRNLVSEVHHGSADAGIKPILPLRLQQFHGPGMREVDVADVLHVPCVLRRFADGKIFRIAGILQKRFGAFRRHNRILPGEGAHPVLRGKVGNPVQLGEAFAARAGAFGVEPAVRDIELFELLQHADLFLQHVV